MRQGIRQQLVFGLGGVFFLLAISGCPTPFQQHEFIGTWRLSSESRVFLKKSGGNLRPWFELKHDGTFVAVDLPQSSFFIRDKWQEFVMDGHGTWRLGTHQNRPVVHLHFRELENYQRTPKDVAGTSNYSFYLEIYHSRSDFYLFYFDDDPDMGREMRYRKDRQ